MQAHQRFGQPLIVPGQSPKARHPAEAALDDPAPRQQDKATLGGRQLDHLKPNTVGSRRRWLLAGVALIDKGDLNRRASNVLYLRGQFSNLRASCSLAGVTSNANNCPRLATAICSLLPLRRLCPSYPARLPRSGRD